LLTTNSPAAGSRSAAFAPCKLALVAPAARPPRRGEDLLLSVTASAYVGQISILSNIALWAQNFKAPRSCVARWLKVSSRSVQRQRSPAAGRLAYLKISRGSPDLRWGGLGRQASNSMSGSQKNSIWQSPNEQLPRFAFFAQRYRTVMNRGKTSAAFDHFAPSRDRHATLVCRQTIRQRHRNTPPQQTRGTGLIVLEEFGAICRAEENSSASLRPPYRRGSERARSSDDCDLT
jgi:hypothetical protein